jgi:hypothetical protein
VKELSLSAYGKEFCIMRIIHHHHHHIIIIIIIIIVIIMTRTTWSLHVA